MKKKAKLIVIAGLCGLVILTTAATNINKPDEPYTNLQVLPKDISQADLKKIMIDDFEDSIGVSCGFCHAKKKDSDELDYASDAKPEKQIARQMLKMTFNLNRDYFKIENPAMGIKGNVAVTCNTCHRGDTFPDDGAGATN